MQPNDPGSASSLPSNPRKPELLLQIQQLVPYLSSCQNSVCHRDFRYCSLQIFNPFWQLFPTAQCSSNENHVPHPEAAAATRFGGESRFKMPGFCAQRTGPRTDSNHSENITGYQINDWMAQETGVDRLKQAYAIRDWKFFQKDTGMINYFLLRSTPFIVGAGLILESKNITQERTQQKQMFKGKMAVHRLDTYHLWKTILKRSGRLAVAAYIVVNLSHGIAVYQNETTIEGMAFSTVVACGAYSIGSSPKVLLRNLCYGALVGVLGGFCVNRYLVTTGRMQEERHKERVRQLIMDKRSSTDSSKEGLL